MKRRWISALLVLCACSRGERAAVDTLVVYNAASLSSPMRALLDTLALRTGAVIAEEHGGSLELARRITELHRVPDVVALADREVFPELLMPGAVLWYAAFARNRMVVAYTDKSRFASEITPENWRSVILRTGVLLGRTDPVVAPAGYRALIMYELAEQFYREPGLAAKLRAATPARLTRGNAAELAALLEAGELDYIIEYESLARSHKFRFVTLPPDIDLGDAAKGEGYRRASVQVSGEKGPVTRTGAPILYGMSVPLAAPHRSAGERFAAFALGAEGRAMLRMRNIDALERAELIGDSIPAVVRAALQP